MKMHASLFLFVFITVFNLLQAQEFSDQEVSIPTQDPAVTLAGTLSMPEGAGKHPAVLLVWGNGPHTRDMEISGTPVFKQIAGHLLRRGMAVLRVDKRGFGRSTGPKTEPEGNYTTRGLVEDMKAAYHFLNRQPTVDSSRVGLIGNSEGAIIVSIMAAEEKSVDWAMVFGPPAVPGDEIVAEQQQYNRRQLGMSEEVARAVGQVWDKFAAFIKSGDGSDSTYYALGREFLLAHGLEENDERITPGFIDQLLDAYKAPWYRFFFNTDPAEFMERIEAPFLAVFGGEDVQVTVEQNLLAMYRAFQRGGNQHYRIVVLPDEEHFFVRYQDQRMPKHKFGEMQVSERMMTTLTDWLEAENILSP